MKEHLLTLILILHFSNQGYNISITLFNLFTAICMLLEETLTFIPSAYSGTDAQFVILHALCVIFFKLIYYTDSI
jgi:hypothetical protein